MTTLYITLRDLWRLLDAQNRWLSGVLVLLLVLTGALELGAVFFLFGYLGAFSDIGVGASPVSALYRYVGRGLDGPAYAAVTGLVLVAFFAFKNIAGLLTSFSVMRFAMKRYQKIATRLFSGFLETRLEIFNQRGLIVPQQILDSVALVFRTGFVPALAALSDIAIVLTILAALFFVLDPLLVISAGAIFGVTGAILLASTRRVAVRLGEMRMTTERSVRQTMLEGFRGLIDIRIGGNQANIVDRYAASTGGFALADRRARALEMVPRAVNELLLAAGIVLAAVYFAQTSGGLQAALPVLAVMGFAGLRMTAAMSRLSENLQRLRECGPARLRLMEAIAETAPDLLGPDQTQPTVSYLSDEKPLPSGATGRLTQKLSVDDVTLTYPGADAPALREVSITVPLGGYVGLCGPSGSGKSTLALTLIGLMRPQTGQVLCDGWDIFSHIRSWHENIAFVGQTPFIAPRNIRENVAFGVRPDDIDDAQVWRALETAALADFVRERKDGLDAMLGEEGVALSGGQRQRLSIARALYRDPEILVLDEATAALDNTTEAEISAAILTLRQSKTVIVIAHRLATIRDCDVIHYMEDGRILSSGTYAELDASCPPFRAMARREVSGNETP